MSRVFYGFWVYALICLVLTLLYGYYTEIFEPRLLGYNLSFWSALAGSIVLVVVSVISLKESKVLPMIGLFCSPLSTYLFFKSWTELNYVYLALFLAIPIVLLSGALIFTFRSRKLILEKF